VGGHREVKVDGGRGETLAEAEGESHSQQGKKEDGLRVVMGWRARDEGQAKMSAEKRHRQAART